MRKLVPSAALLSLLAALLVTTPGAAQTSQYQLFAHDGAAAGVQFGSSSCGLGDVNKDGYPDYAVQENGAVSVFSGADGLPMRQILLPEVNGARGGVYPAGDVNKDGIPDLIVGAALWNQKTGRVLVISGLWLWRQAGPRDLWEFRGKAVNDLFGSTAYGIGDADGDGYPEIAVSANNDYFILFSGKTGAELWKVGPPGGPDGVAPCGDVDNDGAAEFMGRVWQSNVAWVFSYKKRNTLPNGVLYTIPMPRVASSFGGVGDFNADGHDDFYVCDFYNNVVKVFSGKDGKSVLLDLSNSSYGPQFGYDVAVGDLDGDQVPDFAVGNGGSGSGPVRTFSGKTAKLIDSFPQQGLYWLGSLGDVNADGHADFIVRQPFIANHVGRTVLYSGRSLPIAADKHVLPLAKGGIQSMSLRTGTSSTTKYYLVLGSLGTSPGMNLGSVHLPLNPDPYFSYTLGNPNQLIQSSLGLVSSSEPLQSAQLVLPPGLPPSLAGTRLYHSFLMIQLNPFNLEAAANLNAVVVTLQ